MKMWRIGRQMTISREAITLPRTTLTNMITTSRPPTTLNVELRQSGRTAGLRTAAVAETSLTEGSTATPATKALTDVVVNMDPVQHAEELTSFPLLFQALRFGVERHSKTWHDYQLKNVIKLLSGERLGWWSAQKFDKRVRMRALVQGAVNDARTRILLATGANVSVISERFAKQLRMREVRDHGRCTEIQGFTKGTMATTKRALARVTLGWNQVYEYELWVMDHGAGVGVVLGTDFMIPAGVRLELFHATARLPDEVEIPLIKTQRMADTREEGPHVPDGPTEVLTIPAHESRDYGPMRQPPADETHELWVRRTKELIPKCATATTEPSTEMEAEVVHQEETRPKPTAHSDRVSEGSEGTQLKLEGAYLAAATVSEDWGDRDASNASEHPAASTTLDYTGPHVQHPSLGVGQQVRVVKVLKGHERIVISSGNALPPSAYGVVCDFDVQGHPPIKQKARGIPLRHLKQLYELLMGLLKAGLIAFSDSPWASPIVIVLKKNGVDIRLCVDYTMVTSVTAIMEYAMTLVDELLTDMEKYLCDPRGDMFASGETDQSSLVPVFERRSFVDDICFGGESFDSCLETLDRLLSRFEECRISVSFTKRMFVQPTVDLLSHAVRFIQDFAVYGAALYQVREEDFGPGGDLPTAKRSFAALQAKVANAPILRHFDSAKEVHVMLFANDWALSTTLMQEHDGVMHPARFCGRVLKDNAARGSSGDSLIGR
ncbi:unnamed protein product [Phytophthora fragariaefolia]|uniref:Unnamed protein product n=1 Tax=Phytophthora fragariaefolia TaxID=1490495 RepID=A0A9W6TGN1_9STRA|nr:unnamed protein product [Phytophthora fragariaefolia]